MIRDPAIAIGGSTKIGNHLVCALAQDGEPGHPRLLLEHDGWPRSATGYRARNV